jgi:CDP-glucose 4,6-dehydratase
MSNILDAYKGKRVLVTGHTGFKGSWLTKILQLAGAEVTGYALEVQGDPSLFWILGGGRDFNSVTGDIRDFDHFLSVVREAKPEYIFHLAAQPIVRESYRIPRETFETNIMGTVNLLEAVRETDTVLSLVNVTTDKVYLNREIRTAYRETDPLDGYDPYSNSKSCSDLVTGSYRNSFFQSGGPAVSTVRAGNVIGGGDFAKDRIIPDCVRAVREDREIILRNPDSIRPYQHVLEPLCAYLLLGSEQVKNRELAGAYNVGPDIKDAITTGELADLFTSFWGENARWISRKTPGPHEASLLMLDSTKLKTTFSWKPKWDVRQAVKKTVEWYRIYSSGGNADDETTREIKEYFDV